MYTVRQALPYVAVAVGAAAVGFVAGLLLAPASGAETRRRISRRLDEERLRMKKTGRETVHRAAEYASDAIAAGLDKADALLRD